MSLYTFADSTKPQNLNTQTFPRVALYSQDCAYPCPPAVLDKWPDPMQRRWITQRGDATCSIMDYEPLTYDYQHPAMVRDWLESRIRDKTHRVPWIYCDLENAALAAEHAAGYSFYWWIATLDSVKRSAVELSNLLRDWGVSAMVAAPGRIAAQQWKDTGTYDESIGFGYW